MTQPAPNVDTATISLKNLRSGGYATESYRDVEIYGGDSKHYGVTYTASTGTLQYEIPGRAARLTVPNTAISSAFKVYLNGDTASNVITAIVTDSQLSTTGAYFYGQPTLDVSGPLQGK